MQMLLMDKVLLNKSLCFFVHMFRSIPNWNNFCTFKIQLTLTFEWLFPE